MKTKPASGCKMCGGVTPDLSWLHSHTWLAGDDLDVEFVQAEQEGRDLAKVRAKITALKRPAPADRDAAWYDKFRQFAAEVQTLPLRKGYTYDEPSAYDAILAARGKPRVDLKPYRGSYLHFCKQLDAGWVARICGCLLGKPVEGWRRETIAAAAKATGNFPLAAYLQYPNARAMRKLPDDHPLRHHDAPWFKARGLGVTDGMVEDDDTNYTVTNFAVVKRHGASFTPSHVANFWLNEIPILHTCTAERVAYRNFCLGYAPPQSAIVLNPYREWIGAQIRADYFGYANPGNPARAAEWAWRDASISHVKNGIYGEMWAAAAIAAAYVEESPANIIRAGLDQIPRNSRLHEDLELILALYDDKADFESAVEVIHAQWSERTAHDWCHTNSNAQLVAAAVLWHANDLNAALCAVVSCGFDTDCNGATVGSILGIRSALAGFRPEWRAPLKNRIITGIAAYRDVAISALSEDMASTARDNGALKR